jgi:two-component system response regulator CpxR
MARVLIVDHDPDVAQVVAEILSLEGFEAHTATNRCGVGSALEHAPFDLVLTDLWAPPLAGSAVELGELRRRAGGAPVIVITARSEAAASPCGYDLAGIVAKPFEVDDLLATVWAALPTQPAGVA